MERYSSNNHIPTSTEISNKEKVIMNIIILKSIRTNLDINLNS